MTIKLKRPRRDLDDWEGINIGDDAITPSEPHQMEFAPLAAHELELGHDKRSTRDSKSFYRNQFWKNAAERCSPMELAILAARAAGDSWETIATTHNVSERHVTRLATQAASRITGVRPPFQLKTPPAFITYAIQAKSGGPIKIGKASKSGLERRRAELNVGHPETLVVVAVLEKSESDAHFDLRRYRQRGEWFADHPEVHAYIDTYRIEDENE